jgi:hypothetical protein
MNVLIKAVDLLLTHPLLGSPRILSGSPPAKPVGCLKEINK